MKTEEDIYENYDTRHSTEPNRQIIQLNLQDKITILPKTQLARNIFSDLNKTSCNYYSNNLNTSVLMLSPSKTSTNERKKTDSKANKTFTIDRLNDKGFSFLNSYKNNKISERSSKKLNTELDSSVIYEAKSVRRNLNESFNFALRSNKSSDSLFMLKKKKKELDNEVEIKIKDAIDVLNYNSNHIKEILDIEIDKQKRSFEEKKEHANEILVEKKKKYLKRKGSLFEKVIKTMVGGAGNQNQEIVKKIFDYAENKIIDEQNNMHKEIENFLIDNISEMEKEICLITEEYEDDISKFDDEDFYRDVIAKLRVELNTEIKKSQISTKA